VEALPHASRDERDRLFGAARVIVGRSGYSTLMDVAQVGARALLVPMRGQTEQEYLAARLARKGLVHAVAERDVDLARDVPLARNLGARASGGEVLVFLDADTALPPAALDAIAAAVPARADYGTCRIRPDRTTLPAVLTATVLAWGHRLAGTSLGILFCTRALFERAGAFDERLHAGEDNDLNARFRRLGARRIYLGQVAAYTSMRRFERLGYVRVHLAWLRGYFRPPAEYEVI